MGDTGPKIRKPSLDSMVPKGQKDVTVKATMKKETELSKEPGEPKVTLKERISKRQRFKDRKQPLLPDFESKLAQTGLLDVVKDSSMDFALLGGPP